MSDLKAVVHESRSNNNDQKMAHFLSVQYLLEWQLIPNSAEGWNKIQARAIWLVLKKITCADLSQIPL